MPSPYAMPNHPLRPLEEVATAFFPVDWITASPLHLAAATNAPLPEDWGAHPDDLDVALYLAIRARADASVRALIDAGANVDAPRCSLTAPLWEAVAEGHGPSIEALLETGRCDLLTSDRWETDFSRLLRRDMHPWIIERIMRALADLPPCTSSGQVEPSPADDDPRETDPADGIAMLGRGVAAVKLFDPRRVRHGAPDLAAGLTVRRRRRDAMVQDAWRVAMHKHPDLLPALLAVWPDQAREFVWTALRAKNADAAIFVLEQQPVDDGWADVAKYAARDCPPVYEHLRTRGLGVNDG